MFPCSSVETVCNSSEAEDERKQKNNLETCAHTSTKIEVCPRKISAFYDYSGKKFPDKWMKCVCSCFRTILFSNRKEHTETAEGEIILLYQQQDARTGINTKNKYDQLNFCTVFSLSNESPYGTQCVTQVLPLKQDTLKVRFNLYYIYFY